ncbi:serine/arginine-rich SC35-like splicing factor SCL33 isoform X2 [Olea europaea var. sylvestris]|nr:serine/arginine-rich SC35-like splicing factor SCL33 isoform X2 [Olea europaea var. sylvestris]XP_022872007.1 serine/arginine-rich SC35-like splicing factor SCL33 isoform X2 [Olea europaea var. sylvestris]
MDGQILLGRELTVLFAEENRKKPSEMRARERTSRRSPFGYSRSPRYARPYSRSPSYSRTYSRGHDYYSPSPRGTYSRAHDYYSPSPRRRRYSRSISPRDVGYRKRSYSRSPYGSRSRSRSPVRSRSPDDYSR